MTAGAMALPNDRHHLPSKGTTMKTLLRTRTLGLAALALTASMSLAACGNEADEGSATESQTDSDTQSSTESEDSDNS